jgi:uncharacterized protein DUF4446
MAERLKATVLKTVMGATPSWVQIPLSPHMIKIFKKKGQQPKTIEEVVVLLEEKEKEIKKLSERIQLLEKEGKLSVKKIGLIRYNSFSGVGGNQSFSLALLNDSNDGITLTSIYSNEEGSRVYGKTIENGKSNYSLSAEESQAIKEAQDGK